MTTPRLLDDAPWPGHWYETAYGVVPSVTTVLQATADTEALDRWRERVGEEEAERICQEAQERGQRLHRRVEARGEPDGTCPWHDSLEGFLGRCQREPSPGGLPWVERPLVWAPPKKVNLPAFAGTVDWLGEVDGEVALVDWKTAARPKGERWVQDYLLQAAAYSAMVRQAGHPIERAFVVIALEDRPAQEFVVEGDELRSCWRAFCARLGAFARRE